MSACTICGRESSTCPGHLNERSDEIARLREERDQARAEAMALRDALESARICMGCQDCAGMGDLCSECAKIAEEGEKALVTPSEGHLRAHDLEVSAHAYKAAILVHAQQYDEEDLNELWENSILRASLGKEGA